MPTLIPEAQLVYQGRSESSANAMEARYKLVGLHAGEDSGMSLSETFRVLANLLKSGAIKEFALTRTTIEQVFTNFAKFQINDSNQAYAALPTSDAHAQLSSVRANEIEISNLQK